MGAVQLGAPHAQSFFGLIRQSVSPSHNSRGVQRFVGPRNRHQEPLLLIHLHPVVARALDDGHPALVNFLKKHQGVYLPGLRRSKSHRTATRRKRHANISTRSRRRRTTQCTHGSICAENRAEGNDTLQLDPAFTFSEMFAGIGGFRLGLEALGGKSLFANEMDPYAAATYRAHFDSAAEECQPLVEADILDLCAQTDLPADVDVLTAGFPCQPFSERGTQQGFRDERGHLYREIVRVLRASHPKSFIFENVSGLVKMGEAGGRRFRRNGPDKPSKDVGSVFHTMLCAFEACGYRVTWNICNSRHYLAQNRARVFIVGVRSDLSDRHPDFSWDWYDRLSQGALKAKGASMLVRDIMEPPGSSAVAESELSNNQWTKVQDIHSKRYGGIDNARIHLDKKAPTLISSYRRISSHTSKFIFQERDGTPREIPRFLTPRECSRLQGFPEDFVVPSVADDGEVVTAHFYAGIGNAVVPQIVTSIGRELVRLIRS